jgi:Type II CAAX prenyl endopeptidase Rce1-like
MVAGLRGVFLGTGTISPHRAVTEIRARFDGDRVGDRLAGRDEVKGIGSAFEPSIVSSALLFAAMHVSLLWSSAGVKGGLAIVLAMLNLGWACAVLRARTESLWPAIACHVIGNVAADPGGIVGVILYRLIYGRLPEIITSG